MPFRACVDRLRGPFEMDDMTAQFENVLAEIRREMRGVRDELAKLRTLDHFDTRRDLAKPRWLN